MDIEMVLVHEDVYLHCLDIYCEAQHEDINEDLYMELDEVVRPSKVSILHNDDLLSMIKIPGDLLFDDWPKEEYPEGSEFYVRKDLYVEALLTYH